MSNKLTAKQQRILDFIWEYIEVNGFPPSVREIGQAIGTTSSATAHGYIDRLEKNGYIKRAGTKNRAFSLTDKYRPEKVVATASAQQSAREYADIPLIGKVAAGQPLLAFEDFSETFPIPVDMLSNDEHFMLEVSGDSMINAGILSGDYVLVKKTSVAKNGEIVVALIEDEATVKRYYKEKNHYRLQPENDELEPIIVDSLEILGLVCGLIRTKVH